MSNLRDTANIDRIIIHCADVPNGAWWSAEDIDNWHHERGFKREVKNNVSPRLRHIGYHYVIDLAGQITPGRALNETGAHVKGHNANSVGICLIGHDQYTECQLQSLRRLVLGLQSLFNIGNQHVLGHCDLDSGKTCPGFDVQTWLNANHWPDLSHPNRYPACKGNNQ